MASRNRPALARSICSRHFRLRAFENLEGRLALSATVAAPPEGFQQPLDIIAPTSLGVDVSSTVRIGELSLTGSAADEVLDVVMKVNHGTLSVDTSVPGGVTSSELEGNGTDLLHFRARMAAIQATLADLEGLQYTNINNPNGTGALAVTATEADGDTDFAVVRLALKGPIIVSAATSTSEGFDELPSTSSISVSAMPLVVGSEVVGRHLFYNNSPRYDVVGGPRGPLPNGNDNAIAIDKVPYRAGDPTADIDNVTSYTRGINGVMVDLLGIGDHVSITLAEVLNDFSFRVGNGNLLDSWTDAPYPIAVNVRTNLNPAVNGAGAVSGADRIELIWADGAIQQQWLEVRVKATANTGLTADDVFYFGSQIGNTGAFNTATVARTGTPDIAGVQVNAKALSANIPITNTYDFDKDGKVGTGDIGAIQTHGTTATTGLKLLTLLGPFAITSPTGTQTTSTPFIDWEDALGAMSYTVKITSDSAGQNVYKSYTNITESEFLIADGLPNYNWHIVVIANDSVGQTRWATNSGIPLTVDAAFHYIFATSAVFSASQLGSIAQMDDIATLYAFYGNLIPDWDGVSVIYKAVVSDSTMDARDRFDVNLSIFSQNGQLIAIGDGLWSGELVHAPAYDQNGFLMGPAKIWTGSNADGTWSGQTDGDWSSNIGFSTFGFVDAADGTFLNAGIQANSVAAHIYAIGPF